MSALARYFNHLGIQVSGYDKTETPLTYQLQKEGIQVHFSDDPGQIPESIDLVIYTPAVPEDLNEFVYLRNSGLPIKKRAEVLGDLSRLNKTIAVSGTHGKTTVSTMIAHILFNSSVGCSAFLGGLSKNYNSNFLVSDQSDLVVVEADEFDKSFLQLEPEVTVITSMDADHLDIYIDHNNLKSTFGKFVRQIKPGGTLLLKHGVELEFQRDDIDIYRYSLDQESDYFASNIRFEDGQYVFDLSTPQLLIEDLKLEMPGLINVENAVAATAVSLITGAHIEELRNSLAEFSGIKRRFDVQINSQQLVYIDDYAHHPEEIRKFVGSVKAMFPGKVILGIFQPHLYSRTKDFAEEFAKSLDMLDETILLPIYPAREKALPGIGIEIILDKMKAKNKSVSTKKELLKLLETKKFDVILTLGAGDIDQMVTPLKEFLDSRTKTNSL